MPEDKGIQDKSSEKIDESQDKKGGTETTQTVTIDWTKVKSTDIPLELVKDSPEFKKVLQETIERRQKIKALTTDLDNVLEGKKPEDKPESKTKESQGDTDNGMPEWFRPFAAKMENMDKSNLENWRANAGKVTGLGKSPTILKTISGNSEAEVLVNAQKIASELGITAPVVQTSVGNVTGERDRTISERAKKYNRGQRSNDVFNPEFAKAHGGSFEDY